MDLNSKSVEEKIRQYRVFKSCSQSTLMGLCEVANHPMEILYVEIDYPVLENDMGRKVNHGK